MSQQYQLYLIGYGDRRVAIATVPDSNHHKSLAEWGYEEVADESTVMYAIEEALELAGAEVLSRASKDITKDLSEDEIEELYGTLSPIARTGAWIAAPAAVEKILNQRPHLLNEMNSGYSIEKEEEFDD